MDLFEEKLKQDIEEALGWREALQGLDEGDYNQKKEAWWEAEHADQELVPLRAVRSGVKTHRQYHRREPVRRQRLQTVRN